MDNSRILISEILKNEYEDFLDYCSMSGKSYTDELTTTDYIAYRSQYGVSRESVNEIQKLIETHTVSTDQTSLEEINIQKGNYKFSEIPIDQWDLNFYKILKVEYKPYFKEINLSSLDFSVRAINALKEAHCKTLNVLLEYSPTKLLGLRNVGRTTVNDIYSKLISYFRECNLEEENFETKSKASNVFSDKVNHQIYNMIAGFPYSTDEFTNEEINFFQECKEAKDVLGAELALLALNKDTYVIELRDLFDEFNHKSNYLKDIRIKLNSLSTERLNQSVYYYWKVYVESDLGVYSIDSVKNYLGDVYETLEDKKTLIKTLPNIFSRKINDEKAIRIFSNFVNWICSDLNKAMQEMLEYAINQDNKRTAQVLLLRANGKTLEEVGTIMNITRERVRQMESKAIRIFKQRCSKFDVVLTICALKGGQFFLYDNEIRSTLGDDIGEVFCYLLKRGEFNCEDYYYDKKFQFVIINTDGEQNDFVDIALSAVEDLPDGIFENEMDEFIEKISDNNPLVKQQVVIEINREYKLYGKYYHRGRLTVVEICDYILKNYFPNGYKVSDIDYEKQFRYYMQENFGDVKGLPTIHSIDSKISEVGLLYDKGVYIHPSYIPVGQKTVDRINQYIGDSPRMVLSYEEIFHGMAEELMGTKITNKYILHGVLIRYGCPYIIRKDYVTKEPSRNMSDEFNQFIKGKGRIHKSLLMEEFSFDPVRVDQILARCPEVILVGEGYCMHSSNLRVSNKEKDSIRKYIKSVCTTAPVSVDVMMDDFNIYFTDFLINNDVQSPGNLFGILQYLFKEEFYFSRPFISVKDLGKLNRKNVLLEYIKDVNSIDIEDLNDICKTAGINFITISEMIAALYPEFLRINETTMQRRELIGMTDDIIHQTAKEIQTDLEVYRYLPVGQIDDFSWFPDINVEWTPFLVESIMTEEKEKDMSYTIIPTGDYTFPTVIFLGEEFKNDNYEDFIIKILMDEQDKAPFNSRKEILDWLIDKGLCYKKMPSFLEDNTYLNTEENGSLRIKNG